jgi:hypothetical protein
LEQLLICWKQGGKEHKNEKTNNTVPDITSVYSTSTFTTVASHFNYKSVFGVLERNVSSFDCAADAQSISNNRVKAVART